MFTRCNIPTIPTCCAAAASVPGTWRATTQLLRGARTRSQESSQSTAALARTTLANLGQGKRVLELGQFQHCDVSVRSRLETRISQREGAHGRFSQRTYLSAAAAKLAAFDVLPMLAQRWEKGR